MHTHALRLNTGKSDLSLYLCRLNSVIVMNNHKIAREYNPVCRGLSLMYEYKNEIKHKKN